MKKKVIVILIIVFLINLTACKLSNSSSERLNTQEKANDLSVQVMDCFLNKDAEGLDKLLCQGIRYTHDIEAEIQAAFEFVDGNIVSYDEPEGSIGGWATRGKEGVVIQSVSGEINSIKTDTGKTYLISFAANLVYKDDTDKEGVTVLGIWDMELYEKNPDNPEIYERKIGGNK